MVLTDKSGSALGERVALVGGTENLHFIASLEESPHAGLLRPNSRLPELINTPATRIHTGPFTPFHLGLGRLVLLQPPCPGTNNIRRLLAIAIFNRSL